MNDLKSELSGNLEDCLLALLEPASLFDAKCLRRAMRVRYFFLFHIMCGYQCDEAVNKNDTRQVI